MAAVPLGNRLIASGPVPSRLVPRDPAARLALLIAAFALTRFAVLVVTRARGLYAYQDDPLEISVFSGWGAAFTGGDGPAPLRDGPWEYPAGAALVIAAPALLKGAPYVLGFVGQMALWDVAILLVLALVGLRRGSLAGAWLWVAVVPLLGPVALARFDVVPTALAVAGLAAPPLAAGLLLGLGAVVKLWPALLVGLLLLLQPGRLRVLLGSVAVGIGTLLAVRAYGGAGQLLSFLTYQRDRGLEVESVPALPLMIARSRGATDVTVGFAFGSNQVNGPAAGALALGSTVGLVAVVVAVGLLAVRARRGGADPTVAVPVLATLAMAGVLVFDKVLSAQYPLWLAGLVCLALCRPGSPLRGTVAPLCGLLALTQLVYPLSISTLVSTTDLRPMVLLAARDLLLVVVVALAARAAWRLSSGARAAA